MSAWLQGSCPRPTPPPPPHHSVTSKAQDLSRGGSLGQKVLSNLLPLTFQVLLYPLFLFLSHPPFRYLGNPTACPYTVVWSLKPDRFCGTSAPQKPSPIPRSSPSPESSTAVFEVASFTKSCEGKGKRRNAGPGFHRPTRLTNNDCEETGVAHVSLVFQQIVQPAP